VQENRFAQSLAGAIPSLAFISRLSELSPPHRALEFAHAAGVMHPPGPAPSVVCASRYLPHTPTSIYFLNALTLFTGLFAPTFARKINPAWVAPRATRQGRHGVCVCSVLESVAVEHKECDQP
jgi:hypothetical protein